ncbi:MAG: glyoxalase family protein [Thermomicrobiales bacterium]|jgi:glyoxalase family protein|nr:glyoxalase family protein [Thermomicrobiales bacterium]
MELGGLHHLTAVTGDAPGNVAFYTQVLGMRLVKKTVNQDDVSAYHLFYGDEVGNPGTEMTFFDWPGIGPNIAGAGSIAAVGLRVAGRGALDWWRERLDEAGVALGEVEERNGRPTLPFADPEGQRLVLVADGGNANFSPWAGSTVPADLQIRGLSHVALVVDRMAPTAWVLTEALGFRRGDDYPAPDNPARPVAVFETGPGGPGAEVHVEERPELPPARLGIGGVHHVAFRTPTDEEHQGWQQRIARAGLGVTQVIDRYYFHSIYFREPGRVLFEIATDGPGFATDEDAAHLGERLALPPFLESHRAEIEAGLRPLTGVGVAR